MTTNSPLSWASSSRRLKPVVFCFLGSDCQVSSPTEPAECARLQPSPLRQKPEGSTSTELAETLLRRTFLAVCKGGHLPAMAGDICGEETRPQRGGRPTVTAVNPVSEARSSRAEGRGPVRSRGPRQRRGAEARDVAAHSCPHSPIPRRPSGAGAGLTRMKQPDPWGGRQG